MQLSTSDLNPGDVLGRYQLLLPIATGGKSEVWVARQRGHGGFQKLVAIKTTPRSAEDSRNLEAMLFDEASLASLVRHPNVAETLDLGERVDGTLYLVMEWVNGEPLDEILRAAQSVGGIPTAIAVHLIIEACKGLHAVHIACNDKGDPLGIVHRNVSPRNLLVTYSGAVKLVDFGTAKATRQMSQPLATGHVKNKPLYLLPDQVQGDKLDARVDVFAMGIVLYRITTGAHPFKPDAPVASLINSRSRNPTPPSAIVPDYPKTLEGVVMKALARDREERFESARALMVALQQSLPAIVQAHSERHTEVFLERLFAKRVAARQEALQAALLVVEGTAQMLALGRDGTKEVCSVSSMSAVSMETGERRVLPTEQRPVVISFAPNRRWARTAYVAIAAGMVGAIGATAFRKAPVSALAAAEMIAPVSTPAAVSVTSLVVHERTMLADESSSRPAASSAATLASAEALPPAVPANKKRGTR